jgi:RNA polymerase sigma factor (sigma-70 family)
MRAAPGGDSTRDDRHAHARSLWQQMQSCVPETDAWWRLRTELYEMYERLSFTFGAKWFGNKRLSPDDIRQCCRIAVIKAIDAWDPERGCLTTMIAFKVSVEIRRWLRVEQLYQSTASFDRDNIEQEECQVRQPKKSDLRCLQFDAFRGSGKRKDESSDDFTDFVLEQSVDSHEETSVLNMSIEQALAALDPVKRDVVERYYGLRDGQQHGLRDLAPVFAVSYQTIANRLNAAHRLMAPLLEGYR